MVLILSLSKDEDHAPLNAALGRYRLRTNTVPAE
jgi:hypothetical protein